MALTLGLNKAALASGKLWALSGCFEEAIVSQYKVQ